ncbi:SprT-like family-domain-containing protein [Radiomyces spectabilis]|uniref:SprT-like family-domain-containing protein n=1 Tax=Radiomyces spectabilis TaxID=64574 RepID=UPI00221E99B9|nr:SprT-like family-domain-containing protein [Radiomyces spectabilis]KAI8374324.1 SprT-like family-domain-containing protein [Radiomyces spectabilis]
MDPPISEDEAYARLLQQEEDQLYKQQQTQADELDAALAQFLQDEENAASPVTETSSNHQVYDPNPDLHELFLAFNQLYFDGKLDMVEVKWSQRMTLCAGLCEYRNGGLCTIKMSEPLLKFRSRQDMVDTLLHEMIHALLFVTKNFDDHESHGPEFLRVAARINAQAGTNITVYHNFHDEVDYYRTHVWQCDGVCQTKPPYFGIVKRSMNRPPQPADSWFADHQLTCGGQFHKISEPERKRKKGSRQDPKQKDITQFLTRPSSSSSSKEEAPSPTKRSKVEKSKCGQGKDIDKHTQLG